MNNTKNNNKASVSAKQAADTFNELATIGESSAGITYEAAFDMLDNAPDAALEGLNSEYFTFDMIGEVKSFVCEGFTTLDRDGKQIPVVKLSDKDRNNFINGDKMLYSACQRLTTLPAWIKVTYEGDVKNATGTYKRLKVQTFAQPKG